MTPLPGIRIVGQEQQLLDYLQRLEKHRLDRHAAHLRLSALRTDNRKDRDIRLALTAFDSLSNNLLGQAFLLANKDVIVIYKGQAADGLKLGLDSVRCQFAEDPLITEEAAGRNNFVLYYNLENEFDQVVGLVDRLRQDEITRVKSQSELMGRMARVGEKRSGELLTPEILAEIEAVLAQANLANVLRRQSICAWVKNNQPKPVSNEVFVSISDLRKTLLPAVDLNSNPWLFQQLTETLDRRVLALLSKHDDNTLSSDISININVSTILSPEFQAFDYNVKASARGTITLELQKADIFADLGAYLFARDYARDRGYRILVDGLSISMLPFVNRGRLGADLVKVIWNPVLADQDNDYSELLPSVGLSRIVLARCDTPSAIEWGHQAGITLFQGRIIDQALTDLKRTSPFKHASPAIKPVKPDTADTPKRAVLKTAK